MRRRKFAPDVEATDNETRPMNRLPRFADTVAAVFAVSLLLLWAVPIGKNVAAFAATLLAVGRDPPSFRRALRTPGAGVEVLPPIIRQSARLIERSGAARYRLSAELANDGWFSLQTEVMAWPRRPTREPDSPTL